MPADLHQLEHALTCGSDEQKLSALRVLRNKILDGEPSRLFDLAREHVGSSNHDVRWQAIILIGEYIPSGRRNEEIWNLIVEFCGIDDDMQAALATILLEHLLEYDFDSTVDRIKTELQGEAVPLIDLLERCWRFGQREAKWRRLQQIIKTGKGGRKRSGKADTAGGTDDFPE